MKTQAQEAKEIIADFEWLAGDIRGRRILYRLFCDCGVFGPANADPSTALFTEGRRSVALPFMSLATSQLGLLASLLSENLKAEQRGRRGSTDPGDPGSDDGDAPG